MSPCLQKSFEKMIETQNDEASDIAGELLLVIDRPSRHSQVFGRKAELGNVDGAFAHLVCLPQCCLRELAVTAGCSAFVG